VGGSIIEKIEIWHAIYLIQYIMQTRNAILSVLMGIAMSIAAQYVGFSVMSLLPIQIQRIDPAIDVLYSSIGLIVSAVCALCFSLRKKWASVVGLGLGILLWWPVLMIGMAITGTWL
jgi:uncharacterized membrane protein